MPDPLFSVAFFTSTLCSFIAPVCSKQCTLRIIQVLHAYFQYSVTADDLLQMYQ